MEEEQEKDKLGEEFAVFREDIVRSTDDDPANALLGVVEAVGGHSDSEEDEEDLQALQKGAARVSWYKRVDNPATVAVHSLEVVDRALLHHDVVARRSAPLGQSGYVTAVDVSCIVRFLATGQIVDGVDSRLLQQVQPVKQGTYVVLGQWLGKVDEVLDSVVLRMVDGSVCRIPNADPEFLIPVEDEGFNEDTPYYPGLRVRAKQGVFIRAHWLKGGPKSGVKEGVVLSVEPGRTTVQWIAANQMETADAVQPMQMIDGRKLHVLGAFAHTWWQLGDMALYEAVSDQEAAQGVGLDAGAGDDGASSKEDQQAPKGGAESPQALAQDLVKTGDSATEQVEQAGAMEGADAGPSTTAAASSEHSRRPGYGLRLNAWGSSLKGGGRSRDKKAGARKGHVRDDLSRCVEIVKTTTTVEVKWQDGTVEGGLRTVDLVPVKHMGAHDFYPEEYVIDKVDEDPVDVPPPAPMRPGQESGSDADPNSSLIPPEPDFQESGNESAQGQEAAAGDGAGLGGSASGGGVMIGAGDGLVQTDLWHGVRMKIPEHLVPTLNQARQQLHEHLRSHLSPDDAARLEELMAAGNLSETLQFVSANLHSHTFLQNMLRTPQWQAILRSGVVQGLAHEFLSTSGQSLVPSLQRRLRFGVLKMIDFEERICHVDWIGICNFDGSREIVGVEAAKESAAAAGTAHELPLGLSEVSCYDLLEHPEYTYSIGDVVVRLQKKDSSWSSQYLHANSEDGNHGQGEEDADEGGNDGWETTSEHTDDGTDAVGQCSGSSDECGDHEDSPQERSADKQIDGDELRNLVGSVGEGETGGGMTQKKVKKAKKQGTWVGEMMALKGGKLQVQWLDGSVSWVWPCEVFVVSQDDPWMDNDEDGSGASLTGSDWETVNSDEGATDIPNADGLDASEVMGQLDRFNAVSPMHSMRDAGDDSDEDGSCDSGSNSREQCRADGSAEAGDADQTSAEQSNRAPTFYAGASIRRVWKAVGAGIGALLHARMSNDSEDSVKAGVQAGQGQGGNSLEAASAAVGSQQDRNLREGLAMTTEEHYGGYDAVALASDGNGARGDDTTEECPHASYSKESGGAKDADEGGEEEGEEEGAGEGGEEEEEEAFEVVPALPGHKFEASGFAAGAPSKEFVKCVRKEWKLLRKSLPPGIFVRVSEQRMDLLRAVILGPAKTPYEDGFYVFDVYLPPEYPSVAPQILFISYGDRLNPNLYDNGKVCLSLLGTWGGSGVETWNPAASSVLQVLVSIQGLVLVSEPYYNEAGYEKQLGTQEGRHNSKQYNEATLLLVLKHMIFTLTHPTQPLQPLIRRHFSKRSHAILRRCQKILDNAGAVASTGAATEASHADAGSAAGVRGDADDDADRHKSTGWADRSVPESASKGFIRSLEKLMPRLRAVLLSA